MMDAAELDALPVGQRVTTPFEDVYTKLEDGSWDTPFDDVPRVSSTVLALWDAKPL